MKNINAIQKCFQNICENYNIVADLQISEPLRPRVCPDQLIAFVELNTISSINFHDKELNHISKTGIKSNKDYRKLRSITRIKLIDAIRSLRDLTEENLRNLGARI